MNTNPQAIKVLCYGDSNTWGQKPDKSGRYPANIRWTGVLQQLLGNGYYIVEEGLGSRTTDLEYGKKPGRNGKTYFQPCLESYSPFSILVLMLGSNDLKIEFDRSPQQIAQAISGLFDDIRQYGVAPEGEKIQTILTSPILIDSGAPRFKEFYEGVYSDGSAQKSKELANELQKVSENRGCKFIDAAKYAHPGEDGLHMAEESNTPLAEAFAKVIKDLLND